MASMREVMSRPNVLIASTLVLVLGSLFCYKYVVSEQQPTPRSITKKHASDEKEANNVKESEDVSETKKTATATAPVEPNALTKSTTEESQPRAIEIPKDDHSKSNDETAVQGTPVIESIVTVQKVLDVDSIALTESTKARAAKMSLEESNEKTEAPAQEVPVTKSWETVPVVSPVYLSEHTKDDQALIDTKETKLAKEPGHVAAVGLAEGKEKADEQHQSETESSGSDELMFDRTSSQGLTLNEASVPVPPAASSSNTSLDSSASAEMTSDKTYPDPTPSAAASLNATGIAQANSTGFWQQPTIKAMPQTASGGWHPLSAKEFKPQVQNNKGGQSQPLQQRRSFYSVEAGNTIATEFINPTRKKAKRAIRKQMTRQELIQDQWQNHNASFKARCKFWPNCNNRNCKYKHPVKECRWGDECQFGDRCMFLHPRDLAS